MSSCKDTLRPYFEFIAFHIEKLGQPKGDTAGATVYGITKKYYPKEFNKIVEAIDNKNEYEVIMDIYMGLFLKSRANQLSFPLNIQYFDYWFHKPKLAGISFQTILKDLIKDNNPEPDLKVDGIVGNQTIAIYNYVCSYTPVPKIHRLLVLDRIYTYLHTGSSYENGWVNRVIRLEKFILTKEV